MGGEGDWATRGRLYLPIGLFGVAISPSGANNRTRKPKGLKRHLTNIEVNIRPISPIQ